MGDLNLLTGQCGSGLFALGLKTGVVDVYAFPKELGKRVERHLVTLRAPFGRIEAVADVDVANLVLSECCADRLAGLCPGSKPRGWNIRQQTFCLCAVDVDRDVGHPRTRQPKFV